MKAQAAHRRIRFPGPGRGRFTTNRPRVFQAWPVAHTKRSSSDKSRHSCLSRKRNRLSTSLMSGPSAIGSRDLEKILKIAEGQDTSLVMEKKPKIEDSANNTLETSQLIDLTADNSVLDLTGMSEAAAENSAVLDDLPTEASFSKHLEERPSTGRSY